MDTSNKLCPFTVAVVILQKELSRLLIESRFGVWVNKETFHSDQDMSDTVARLPILFESVDTDLSRS